MTLLEWTGLTIAAYCVLLILLWIGEQNRQIGRQQQKELMMSEERRIIIIEGEPGDSGLVRMRIDHVVGDQTTNIGAVSVPRGVWRDIARTLELGQEPGQINVENRVSDSLLRLLENQPQEDGSE